MPVSFNSIPPGWKVPLVYIEVDPSMAGTPVQNLYALLTGYKLAAGTATSNVPIAVGNQASANSLFGQGSMLARQFKAFTNINKATPVICLPIDAPSGGTQATGTIIVTAGPTADGIYNLYIAGQKVAVSVAASDATTAVATKINAAINLVNDLPVTSTVSTSTVTITAKNKGVHGNDITLTDNYLGVNGAETMPTTMAVTYSAATLAGGVGVPTWTTAIANTGDEPYEYVSMPFTDSGSITAWTTEYGFGDSGRWGWLREDYGMVFSARRDTYSGHFSYGPSNNSGVISILAVAAASPSPVWEWCAAYTARAAGALSIDPARPLQTLTLDGILTPPKGGNFSKTELNALAGVGLAIQGPDATGAIPMLLREQTTYQKNKYAQPDNAYELVTTLATLASVFRQIKQAITNKYPRHKLANDGTRFGPGQAIVTPLTIKGEIVAQYRLLEFNGLVENGDVFKAYLIVERDTNDPNRVNVLFPPDIINQLRMMAILGQFRLQFTAAEAAAIAA